MQFNIPAEHKHASGVYIIRNTTNSKVYVGSAVKLWRRYSSHISDLRTGNHANKHLLAHASKYGLGTLRMELLELCERDVLLDKEQHYIDNFCSYNSALGFNIMRNANYNGSHVGNRATLGRKRSPEEIANQVASRRAGAGYSWSEEQRQLIVSARLGVKPINAHTPEAQIKRVHNRRAKNGGSYHSAEGLAKIAESCVARTGSTRPDEVKAKISVTMLGIQQSPESRAKQVASRRAGAGYSMSKEGRAAVSRAKKGVKLSEETKDKMSKSRTGRVLSEETKQKLRDAAKGRIISPEQRAKISATLKARTVAKTA